MSFVNRGEESRCLGECGIFRQEVATGDYCDLSKALPRTDLVALTLESMKGIIFDLDGTLVDSVYPHTLAWHTTLNRFGLECSAWTVHRRIGMSGRLLVKSIARRHGRTLSDAVIHKLEEQHNEAMQQIAPSHPPLPGARQLLSYLAQSSIPHGIATSGKSGAIELSLRSLGLSPTAVVINGEMVREVKPEPDLFLLALKKLEVERSACAIVGDSVWDIYAARRSGIVSFGLLTGGYCEQELYNAGAMRVYADAQALLDCIDELGFE